MKQEYPKRAAAGGWQGTDVRGTAMSTGAEIRRYVIQQALIRIEGNPCGM